MRARLSLTVLLVASSFLSACGGGPNRGGPDARDHQPPIPPERMQQLYHQMIDRWDYDGDGKATCQDMDLQRQRLFKLLDKNKDGVLGPTEYRLAKFEDKTFMFYGFLRVDADSSGTISLAELSKIPHSQFNAADKDHNCEISEPEAIEALREANAGMLPSGREDGRPHRGNRHRPSKDDDGGLLPLPGDEDGDSGGGH
ncbi:hypothetical protein [Kordiimonas marina]|uniref:hypothetical protein n=1 Tax=Kordiimonas marina TaxID=2872312 RepID=UPI001FF134D3|nr:hypothetical protein [Kordiimonas marina]MCJ9427601.1 hypothetical protein [Kordiimonas marina]